MLWKGRTFNQIISKIKKNKGTIEGTNKFISSPVKEYRREKTMEDNCSRATTSLIEFFRPGGTIVNSSTYSGIHILDINTPNDLCETPDKCSVRADDAKRRVRSGGSRLKQSYYTSSTQYLEKRNYGYEQNNYRNYRLGDPTFTTEIPATLQNIYLPNGINHKAKVRITGHRYVKNPIPDEPPLIDEPPLFKYRWVNGQEYPVHIDNGDYNLEEINNVLFEVLSTNKHYLIDFQTNKVLIYFMKFVYDTHSKRIQIQCSGIDSTTYPATRYSPWTSYLYKVDWNIPEYTLIPNIILLDNEFLDIIGFESFGYYPPQKISETEPFTQPDTNTNPIDNIFIGNIRYFVFGENESKITTQYEPLTYKPNNTVFATQGAVSASSVVSRLRYNTITGATTEYTTPIGKFMGSALAYNVPAHGYSYKYVVGYNNGCVPTVKNNGRNTMSYCPNTQIVGG